MKYSLSSPNSHTQTHTHLSSCLAMLALEMTSLYPEPPYITRCIMKTQASDAQCHITICKQPKRPMLRTRCTYSSRAQNTDVPVPVIVIHGITFNSPDFNTLLLKRWNFLRWNGLNLHWSCFFVSIWGGNCSGESCTIAAGLFSLNTLCYICIHVRLVCPLCLSFQFSDLKPYLFMYAWHFHLKSAQNGRMKDTGLNLCPLKKLKLVYTNFQV